jgi:hypothetical protein
MTEKKLSRRDAIKMLGVAAGAAALAGLPSKWNTPEVVAGALPAHARQSVAGIIACFPSDPAVDPVGVNGSPWVANSSGHGIPAGLTISYLVTITGAGRFGTLAGPFSGTLVTDNTGVNDVPLGNGNATGFVDTDIITEVYTFGGHSCTTVSTMATP